MNKFFSPKPLALNGGIAFVRIVTGIFLIYHGCEVFDAAKIKEYATWEMFKNNANPMLMPYLGKAAELVGGALLAAGLFTRLACVIIAGTMLYIAVFIGHGIIWNDDQHPFLFVLLAILFFLTGPGCFALDRLLFDEKKAG